MNRATEWKRLKKLGLNKATTNPEALETAFDPKRAYSELIKLETYKKAADQLKGLRKLLAAYGINSKADLESLLASKGTNEEKPL